MIDGSKIYQRPYPIDEFLEMSKTSDPALLRIMVQRALSHPEVFAGFSELLANICMETKASTSGTENSMNTGDTMDASPTMKQSENQTVIRKTLELFAYGTMTDYVSAPPGTYLLLSPTQEHKLRQLTVVSLVNNQFSSSSIRPGKIPYSTILNAISPKVNTESNLQQKSSESLLSTTIRTQLSIRELENLLISCIYANLINGKLDQRNQMILILGSNNTITNTNSRDDQQQTQTSSLSFSSRDVPLSSIPQMIDTLEKWRNKSKKIIATQLEQAIQKNVDSRVEDKHMWKDVDERIDAVRMKLHGVAAFGGVAAASASGSSGAASANSATASLSPSSATATAALDRAMMNASGSLSGAYASRAGYKANRKRYYE